MQTTDNPPTATIRQRLFVALQHALPQHALSGAMFRLTRIPLGPLMPGAIRLFARSFDVSLDEAADGRPEAYRTFNAFFTRALRDGVRPVDATPDTVLSPVDGTVSQAGAVRNGALIQAKGHDYGLAALLGGDPELSTAFKDGLFATLYLSPRDYHRIHMPLAGKLRETIHVPGRLFSVNPTTAEGVPGLFARNERVICVFDTDVGPMALILVGAIFVGSIETIWSGRITPPRGRRVQRKLATPGTVTLPRGAEMGRFNMGSTVIVLLPKDSARWAPELVPGAAVVCGRPIAELRRG
jgi:phosphatidylserine decarboxylase